MQPVPPAEYDSTTTPPLIDEHKHPTSGEFWYPEEAASVDEVVDAEEEVDEDEIADRDLIANCAGAEGAALGALVADALDNADWGASDEPLTTLLATTAAATLFAQMSLQFEGDAPPPEPPSALNKDLPPAPPVESTSSLKKRRARREDC